MKKTLMILAMITSIATFAFPVNVTAAVDNSTLLSTDITEDETQVQTNLQFSIRTFAYNILDNNDSTILTCIGTPTTDFSGLQITAEPEENITIGEPFKQGNAYCAQIKGQKPGTVTITAKTANGLSATCKLNVLDHTFDFLKSNEEYGVGESYNMTFFTDDSEVQFTIEDESIAKLESVDVRQTQIGLVIDALSVGDTTITALGKDGRNKSIVIHIVDPSQTNPTQEPTTFPFDKPTEPAEQLPTDYADDVAPNTDYDGTPMKVGETRRIHLSHRFGRKLTNVFLQENYNDTKEYLDWVFDEDTSDLIVTALKANYNLMVDIGARECAFTQHFTMQILEDHIGDINSDGEVGVTDAISLQKYLLNMTTYNSAQWQAADLNKDDEVDVYDLGLLKQTLLHKIDIYKEPLYQEKDGVIYFPDTLDDIQLYRNQPDAGTCEYSQLLLYLMDKFPNDKFAVQINSWCDDREAEHTYLRENGVDFHLVHGVYDIKNGAYDVICAILTTEQLKNFPVYENAGYQIGLTYKNTFMQICMEN